MNNLLWSMWCLFKKKKKPLVVTFCLSDSYLIFICAGCCQRRKVWLFLKSTDWFFTWLQPDVCSGATYCFLLSGRLGRNAIYRSTASNLDDLLNISIFVQIAAQLFMRLCGRSLSSSIAATRSRHVIFKTWRETLGGIRITRGHFPVSECWWVFAESH